MRFDRTKVIGRTARYCGLFLGAAVLATGCATTDGGTPETVGSTPSTSASTGSGGGDNSGVPKITGPQLNATRYWDNPCTLLKSGQPSSLGLRGTGTFKDAISGHDCQWDDTENDPLAPRVRVEVSANKPGAQGLTSVYANRPKYGIFEPLEFEGYPAVHGNDLPTRTGSCETIVGVANDVALVASVYVHDQHSADYQAPCGYSDKVAKALLQNLKAGS